MKVNRVVRILSTSLLAAGIACSGSSAIAATPSAVAPATFVARNDPTPQPPWVFSGNRFDSDSGCRATGRAYVNSGNYTDYTCRWIGGAYRLYLLPR